MDKDCNIYASNELVLNSFLWIELNWSKVDVQSISLCLDPLLKSDFTDFFMYRMHSAKNLRACLVRVFVFCFGFMIFYFIEVGTLILIWIQDCKKNSVWNVVLFWNHNFKKKIVFGT